mmetsp:Transcript_2550/g.4279  ORF Transcript_2550/g.4279 Transcript_2550/m.4279 type:complete len:92 (-) Transcript_2550:64-339(-)
MTSEELGGRLSENELQNNLGFMFGEDAGGLGGRPPRKLAKAEGRKDLIATLLKQTCKSCDRFACEACIDECSKCGEKTCRVCLDYHCDLAT